MIPADTLEEILSLLLKLTRTWKHNSDIALFKSIDEEMNWQNDKKKLINLIKTLQEEIKDEPART